MFRIRHSSVLVLLALVGCASTTRLYSGDPRPKEEVAIIKNWWSMGFGTTLGTEILSVDDQSLGAASSVEVLPGRHRVRAGLNWNVMGNNLFMEDPEELVFVAEAGHTYQVKAFFDWGPADSQVITSFWVEDKTSDSVVAGTRLPKDK